MSVKRTSYLNSRQTRSARRSPPSPPPARQRPKTASAASRRRRPPDNRGPAGSKSKSKIRKNVSSKNNNKPLLSRQETEFLFGRGAPAAPAAHDDDVPRRPPSLRQTTLGRMLLNSPASPLGTTSSTGDLRRRSPPAPLSESSSASSLYRRPLSADSCCSGRTPRRRRRTTIRGPGNSSNNISGAYSSSKRIPTCAGGGKAAVTAVSRAISRPSSAAPGDGCRGTWRPPLSTTAAAASDSPAPQLDSGGHPNTGRNGSDTCTSWDRIGGGGDTAMAAKSLARSHAGHGGVTVCAIHDGRSGLSESGTTPRGATSGQPAVMSAHHALEATIKAVIDVVSPLDQFVNARKTIAEMKKINTKDSTGDILLSTQVCPCC